MMETLIVIAKRPVPGRVKTRLTPPLSPTQAARVAAAALTDTLRVVAAAPARHRVLAFDGLADGWLPPGWLCARQPSGDLDARLIAAFGAAPGGPSLLVGMDTPQLSTADLHFDASRFDACVGLSPDGGYWSIGFADPDLAPDALAGVPMSTAHTGAAQLERLGALGLRVQLLREHLDVDDIDDAHVVAAQAPDTEFAAALTRTALKLVS